MLRTESVEQTIVETGEEGRKLKRNPTWQDLSIMGAAVAVGVGIFSVGMRAAASHTGPAVIINFLIAGVMCGAAVMCYAELVSMIPAADSAYTFTYTTVSEITAWTIGWNLILGMLMAGSVISKYWGIYPNDFICLMGWNVNTNSTFDSFHIDIAPIIIVAFFTTLFVFGVGIGAHVDSAIAVLKIVTVFFVMIVGFFYVKASDFTLFILPSQPAFTVEDSSAVTGVMTQPLWQLATGMAPSAYGVPGTFSSAVLVFSAFIGFDVMATASEETKNPHKNVLLGIGVGMLLIIIMYMLMAVATTGMVSYADLAKQNSPSLATVPELVGVDWAIKIISFDVVLSPTTVIMVLLPGPTHIVFAISRDSLLSRDLSKTGRHGTLTALQIIIDTVMALVAALSDVSVLSDMVNIGTLSAFTLVAISIPIMHKKHPDLPRTFKIPGSPWIPILTVVASFWLILSPSAFTWIRFMVWFVIGFVIYFDYGYWHARLGKGDPAGTLSAETGKAVDG